MRIIERGVVFDGSDTPQISSCTFPSMCQPENGRILFSFKGSPQKGPYDTGENGYTCVSDDNGKTYSAPMKKYEPPIVDGKPTTIRTLYYMPMGGGRVLAVLNAIDASDDSLVFYNEETEGLKDTYIMFALSEDFGNTFSELKRIQVQSFIDTPIPLTGAPSLMNNGTIVIQFEVNKTYYDTAPWTHNSVAVYSHDGGQTWGDEVVITNHPQMYYWDQRISVIGDKLLDLFWSFDRDKGDYVNIHACESLDYGRSYSDVWDTGLSGQPGNAVDIGGGKICCVYINRDSSPIVKLAVSADFGRTWRDELSVYDSGQVKCTNDSLSMNDAWSEMGAFSVGHPFMTKMNDGTIIAYYYAGDTTHRTDIHWAKIALD
ncbi:MAG: exo-alpha-sialidase [Clostridia bacterium]|jgi:hypothetical protein|nr:exo-alpha-sialidase [Clostridia bacterium]MBT7122910.1 exo-alpha-sialidase [Clostridia bacterium]